MLFANAFQLKNDDERINKGGRKQVEDMAMCPLQPNHFQLLVMEEGF